jgi:hypothetical protein
MHFLDLAGGQNEGFIVEHQLPGHAISDQSSSDVSGGR